jgi:NACHT domain
VAQLQKRWRLFAFLGGAIFVLGVLLLWFLQYLAGGTLERNAKILGILASVAGPLISAASLGFSILQQRHASAADAADNTEQRSRAAAILAEAVRQQWEDEVGVRSLRRPAPLRLHWLTTQRPVAAPAATVIGGAVVGRPLQLRFHGHLDEIGEKFLALPHRRLVVLGEPGAGKTVLAMLLTLDLLARRRPDDPVPVLLSVSSWNPTTEHLHAWITRRLDQDYPALGNAAAYGPAAAQQLVLAGRVLPILDGLDELPAALRATAIDHLDQARAGRPLVLTCRSQEYQQAVTTSGQLLATAAVVEIQPVTVGEAISFVQAVIPSTDTRWDQVFSELRTQPKGVLAAALSSPLMVALARAVYTAPNRDPGTLVAIARAGDQAAVEHHLLDNFVPAVYTDPPAAPGQATATVRRRSDPAAARRYLAFLAGHLQQHNTRDLAWWELALAVPRRAIGLLVGLLVGLLGWLWGELVGGPWVGLVIGLVGGLWVGLVAWSVAEAMPAPKRLQAHGSLGDLLRRLASGFAPGLIRGLVGGLAPALVVGLLYEFIFGLVVWLLVGLGNGLVGPVVDWLRVPADYELAVTPRSVFHGDRAVAAVAGLVVGLVSGLGSGLVVGLAAGQLVGFAFGLVGGIVGGIVFGLLFVGAGWGWFAIARAWLAIGGRLPWQLMTFLDDAYHRGVLRQAGAAYQFRHARLQDHLADVGQLK